MADTEIFPVTVLFRNIVQFVHVAALENILPVINYKPEILERELVRCSGHSFLSSLTELQLATKLGQDQYHLVQNDTQKEAGFCHNAF